MKYLVPIDFTSVTDQALNYALHISSITGGNIEALHIIKDESERTSAQEKFDALIKKLEDSSNKKIATKIKVGNIFTDISSEADEGSFDLLIMGTHGVKGLQKLFGSNAIKVITSAKTPFIITQDEVKSSNMEQIVLPIDLAKESVQIIRFANELATSFQANIHLVYREEKDEWLEKRLKSNISLAEQMFKSKGLTCKITALPKSKSFHKDVIEYSHGVKADLIALAHHSKNILPQFDQFSQAIITNEHKTPVLIVDALNVSNINSSYSFLTI